MTGISFVLIAPHVQGNPALQPAKLLRHSHTRDKGRFICLRNSITRQTAASPALGLLRLPETTTTPIDRRIEPSGYKPDRIRVPATSAHARLSALDVPTAVAAARASTAWVWATAAHRLAVA
jgi:hypothetical protein